ncbi:MAG: HAD-IC family P-type ATPase [Candidatus Kerfeldbacteria bacterium]|nr:HAD-IC family P-type ATPase [Candidatus Kerfeldbacteria bacterium]
MVTNPHSLSSHEVLKTLGSAKSGLSERVVAARTKEMGPNELPRAKRAHGTKILARQFKSELVIILIAAAAVSFALGEHVDGTVILLAVLVNVVVGFIQEFQAERALDALQSVVKVHTRVMRDGTEVRIDARDLVPGDIILLEAGDTAPADARLLDATNAKANESSLTGESLPVSKTLEPLLTETPLAERTNMVFAGTFFVEGTATAVVTATGTSTEIGHIARLLHDVADEPTPLQKKMSALSRWLGIVVLAISLAVFVLGVLTGNSAREMFGVAVAMAVSAIPEGLLIAVTIVLALGMRSILKQQALARNLLAAETLGSTTVICTDKTGTLTKGEMHISRIVSLNHAIDLVPEVQPMLTEKESHEILLALRIGVLSNNAHLEVSGDDATKVVTSGNPTEQALLLAGWMIGLKQPELEKESPRIAELPFDSTKKYMATLHEFDKETILYVKGAPERVLERSTMVKDGATHRKLDAATRKHLEKTMEGLSREGLRILGIGYRHRNTREIQEEDVQELTFVAFVCFRDPIRSTSLETLKVARSAGIHVVMLTGDHPLTAASIAGELGFPTGAKHVLDGPRLDRISDQELKKRVRDISVYARVTPEHKLRIISAWKARGEVVAMTGDGTNDSPALKKADIGVALGSGTDVAKEASDIVLLDNRFSTIVHAVEQGRVIFDNLKKVTLYLLSDSFGELILVAGSLLLGLPLPILATQILWINIVDDSFPSIALTKEPKEGDVMAIKPRGNASSILDRRILTLIFVSSVTAGVLNLLMFIFIMRWTGDVNFARTMVFTSLAFDSLLYVFSVRSLRHSVFTRSPFSNPFLLVAISVSFAFQCAALYIPFLQSIFHTVPLSPRDWSIVVLISITEILVIECVKYLVLIRHGILKGAKESLDSLLHP